VGVAGNASYASDVFTVKGAGAQIYGTGCFHFVYQPLSGDGTVVARLVNCRAELDMCRRVMIRNTLDAGSANAKTASGPLGAIYLTSVQRAEGTSEPAQ